MKNKIVKIILIAYAFFILSAIEGLSCYLSNISPVFAQPQTLPTSSIPLPTNAQRGEGVVEIKALEIIFSNILSVVTTLAGIAVLIVLISGGFNWMTSGGDPKKAESARNTITYAIVGIILMIIAWLILRFIHEFTGVNVTIFNIPSDPTPTPTP